MCYDLSVHTSTHPSDTGTLALKNSGAVPTVYPPISEVEYFTSTPELTSTIASIQSDGNIWPGPGLIENSTLDTTVDTSSSIIEGSSRIAEMGLSSRTIWVRYLSIYTSAESIATTTQVSSINPTAHVSGKSLGLAELRYLRPRTVHPVQVVQTEDNSLVVEGVSVFETLVSSEVSSSVITLKAFKTIVLTTVSTSMICTCDAHTPCKSVFMHSS